MDTKSQSYDRKRNVTTIKSKREDPLSVFCVYHLTEGIKRCKDWWLNKHNRMYQILVFTDGIDIMHVGRWFKIYFNTINKAQKIWVSQ